MVDYPRAELAMGEVLVFELAIERYFGFQDADVASSGVAADAQVAGPIASAALVSGGQARASIDIESIRFGSARFGMEGVCVWYARGINFRPHMRVNDDPDTRAREVRGNNRPGENRGMTAIPAPKQVRYEETREVVR